MAVIEQTLSGAGRQGENVGKNINVQVLSSTNLTQDQLDSVLEQIAQTTTIVSVGPFTAGATDDLGIVTEGVIVADDSSNAFGIASATWTTVTGF
jgi:hypothetical protein